MGRGRLVAEPICACADCGRRRGVRGECSQTCVHCWLEPSFFPTISNFGSCDLLGTLVLQAAAALLLAAVLGRGAYIPRVLFCEIAGLSVSASTRLKTGPCRW